MNEKEVVLFLKAKKEDLASRILIAMSMFTVVSIIVLEALGIQHDYTIALASLSSVFLLCSMGSSRWVTVSKSELLELIQKQIDSDPSAIQLVAKMKQGYAAPTKNV